MERLALCAVAKLLATTEAVGDHDVRGRRSRGGQEDALADRHRDVVVLGLVTERAGEAAAARVGLDDLEAHRRDEPALRGEVEHGLVMTVSV